MRANFPLLYKGNEAMHMMFRANHIYILFVGLINISVGTYGISYEEKSKKIRQLLGSSFIALSSVLFIFAFFIEPIEGNFIRKFTSLAIMFVAIGTLLHLAASYRK
jgi:uncharacterized membrane protein